MADTGFHTSSPCSRTISPIFPGRLAQRAPSEFVHREQVLSWLRSSLSEALVRSNGENPTSGRAQVCNVNVISQSASKIGSTALRRAIPFSAAGIDGIPTSVLDPMGPDWFKHYQLTQPSTDWQYRPLPLRIFCIIIAPTKALKARLFKVKFKAWRLITLLHTLEKAIESVAANILSTLAKQHGLLPTPTPTGGRPCGTIYHHCSRFPFNPDACH